MSMDSKNAITTGLLYPCNYGTVINLRNIIDDTINMTAW